VVLPLYSLSRLPSRSPQTSSRMQPSLDRSDNLTIAQRRYCMSRIRSKDTKPEMVVRSICHRLGFRFRLHCSALPGSPDLVFRRLQSVIDVRGCFWHAHSCRRHLPPVVSRVEYWQAKFERNVRRDRKNRRALRELGWSVLVIWECETRDADRLEARIRAFLTTAEDGAHQPKARGKNGSSR
jgi:DNA mismatch endonuclease (patch repair protein)